MHQCIPGSICISILLIEYQYINILWSLDNHLLFNETKCVLLKFKSSSDIHDITSYSINNLTISENITHRDLGVTFSVNLQWRPHYENIAVKTYKMLGLLQRIFRNSICYEAKNHYTYPLLDCVCYIVHPYGNLI